VRWDTPDGDFIDVDFLDDGDSGASADSPLVVLFHGLEGHSKSHYARAFAHEVRSRGWRLAIPHFRGCSGEINRLPRAYHSGDSEEIGWILARMRERHCADHGLMFAAGISLGGNALLKWLGETPAQAGEIVDAACGVSAPLDLLVAGDALGRGFNRFYTRMFLATLKAKSEVLHRLHPGRFDVAAMRRSRTLRDFDNAVTAPLHGFRDTDDYWTRASALPHLARISVPTLVINAHDDPFVPAPSLPEPAQVSGNVTTEFPRHGGHVGFVSGRFPGAIDWLPRRVCNHFAAVVAASAIGQPREA
jgi:predicted alpha/beta-fold hydrolase